MKKMDDFMLEKYTEIRVVDMTHTEYVSDENFPLGNSSAHYQSGYYRDLFYAYNKIFMEDIATWENKNHVGRW